MGPDDRHPELPHKPVYDAGSFGAVLAEHDTYLRGVVWAVIHDRDGLDDVMQAAYEKAYRAVDGFDGRSSIRTWLHSICYRTAIDHIRYESRRKHRSLDAVESPDVVEPLTRATTTGEVVQAMEAADVLASLPADQRAMLYLTAGLGYSFDEVAEIVGVKRGTVASRVSRAKAKLRSEVAS